MLFLSCKHSSPRAQIKDKIKELSRPNTHTMPLRHLSFISGLFIRYFLIFILTELQTMVKIYGGIYQEENINLKLHNNYQS